MPFLVFLLVLPRMRTANAHLVGMVFGAPAITHDCPLHSTHIFP